MMIEGRRGFRDLEAQSFRESFPGSGRAVHLLWLALGLFLFSFSSLGNPSRMSTWFSRLDRDWV